MQAEIKKHYKYADYCPCAAHLLNLDGELAASCCIESVNFCSIINELYKFFLASTYIYLLLESHEGYS